MSAQPSANHGDHLLHELEAEARRQLIQDIREGAQALPAIRTHEEVCAVRWKWTQRLLAGILAVQMLQLLGVPTQKIIEAIIKLL